MKCQRLGRARERTSFRHWTALAAIFLIAQFFGAPLRGQTPSGKVSDPFECLQRSLEVAANEQLGRLQTGQLVANTVPGVTNDARPAGGASSLSPRDNVLSGRMSSAEHAFNCWESMREESFARKACPSHCCGWRRWKATGSLPRFRPKEPLDYGNSCRLLLGGTDSEWIPCAMTARTWTNQLAPRRDTSETCICSLAIGLSRSPLITQGKARCRKRWNAGEATTLGI